MDKEIGIIRMLWIILSRNTLFNICKSFIKPNIDNCDFICGQPHNESSFNNLEKLQNNAAVAMTGAKKGTAENLWRIRSWNHWRWMDCLGVFIKLNHEVILSIFTNWFLQKALLIIHITQITFKHIIAELRVSQMGSTCGRTVWTKWPKTARKLQNQHFGGQANFLGIGVTPVPPLGETWNWYF